ncbi:hypothetical protein K3495_g13515 [Podosphaera aphanis]|nr:hypothetical protein K3495_g13515 [Podosphaera aphanis]
MARNWQFIQEYEKYNLADLPTYLRISLLSYIAVYGPNNGVGYEGLKNLLIHPLKDQDMVNFNVKNETFFRLDLSRAIGYSVSFKQITELVRPKSPPADMRDSDLTWEDNFSLSMSLSPPLSYLSHLSLSQPCYSISWLCLLSFMAHVPSLTHLSLAYWPAPSEVPIPKTVFREGMYSRLVEAIDLNEAADILSRLAERLPNLEYLDLSGCQRWFEALAEKKPNDYIRKIEWGIQWSRLQTLQLKNGLALSCDSKERTRSKRLHTYSLAVAVETRINNLLKISRARGAKFTWINFIKDVI